MSVPASSAAVWLTRVIFTPGSPSLFGMILTIEELEQFVGSLVACQCDNPPGSGNPDLAPTPDYGQRTQDVPAPKELKPGFYFIVASPAANFGDAGNTVAAADVWVSDLAIVMRQEWGKGRVEGLAERVTGNRHFRSEANADCQ